MISHHKHGVNARRTSWIQHDSTHAVFARDHEQFPMTFQKRLQLNHPQEKFTPLRLLRTTFGVRTPLLTVVPPYSYIFGLHARVGDSSANVHPRVLNKQKLNHIIYLATKQMVRSSQQICHFNHSNCWQVSGHYQAQHANATPARGSQKQQFPSEITPVICKYVQIMYTLHAYIS